MKTNVVILAILLITRLSFSQNGQWLNLSNPGIISTPVEDGNNLWFPTSGGLVCFNRISGQKTVYNGTNSPLIDNAITDIAIDKNNVLWISTTHHGLFTLNNNVWNDCRFMIPGDTILGSGQIQTDSLFNVYIVISLASDSGLKIMKNDGTISSIINLPTAIRQFDVDNGGSIWAGANWNTIFKYDGLNWISYDSTNSILPAGWGWVQSLACDQNNNVYASVLYIQNQNVFYKSFRFDGTTWVDFPVAGNHDFRGIYNDKNNCTWFFAGITGAIKYDGVSTFTHYTTNDPYWPSNNLTSFYVDSSDHWWIGCTSCGQYAYEIFNYTQIPHNLAGSSIPNNVVHDIAIDKNNNKWVSFPYAVGIFNGTAWSLLTTSNSGINSNSINKLYSDSLGNIWTLSADNDPGTAPLARYDGINWTLFWLDSVPGNSNIKAIDCAHDDSGNLWIATFDGLVKFDGTSYSYYTEQNSGLIDDIIYSVCVDLNNVVWVGTYYGVSSFDGINWVSYTTGNSGLAENVVWDIYSDNFNNKWFQTTYLSKYDGATWTTFTPSQAGSGNFSMGIIDDSQNNLIIGTEPGFSIFDGTSWNNFNGYNSGMTGVANSFALDRGNNLWIGTVNSGIVIYNPAGIDFENYINLPEYEISGNVYFDKNNNGLKDSVESGLGLQKILIKPDSLFTYTANTGYYYALTDKGFYSLEFIPASNWIQTTSPQTYNFIVDSLDISGLNFGAYPVFTRTKPTVNLTSGGNRCFSDIPYWIDYSNAGTTILNGMIEYIKSDSLLFLYSIPPPDSINGSILKWNYNDLMPFESRQIKIIMRNPLDTLVLKSDAYIYSGLQLADSSIVIETVRCSFDPNDKTVSPQGYTIENFISPTDTLTYTIRFQNTGNDTAYNILIIDSLNDYLNTESFEIVASSHSFIPLLNSQTIRFYFPNINLLWEGINEPESHGFIKYRIAPKTGLPDSTQLLNKAFIYFDFNLPIVTNQTLNTILWPATGVSDYNIAELSIFPVPCDQFLNIKFDRKPEVAIIKISDLSGKIIMEQSLTSSDMQIATSMLDNGLYIISVQVKSQKRFATQNKTIRYNLANCLLDPRSMPADVRDKDNFTWSNSQASGAEQPPCSSLV